MKSPLMIFRKQSIWVKNICFDKKKARKWRQYFKETRIVFLRKKNVFDAVF